jgi:hypothetical protein
MPSSFTKKRARDKKLLSHWDRCDEAHFARFNMSRDTVKATQVQLQGHIVLPGDPDYDQDRLLFYRNFNSYPTMIIYCAVESDVAIALQLAQQSSLAFTVRSGGHCTAGFSAGSGALIDVSELNDVSIDAENLVASVGCGCPFSKFSSAMQLQGMHVPIGECEDVCVGGFVQGGGYGFTSVTYGMNCDNVIDMRVMLADGSIVTASPTVNYDLWWAMRGGTGGTFGVLLSVRYRLRPLGDVFGWALIWALDTEQDLQYATGALMELQANYMRTGSPQMNIQVSLCFQPGEQAGMPPTDVKPYLMVRGLYVGDTASGEAAIAPLQALPGAVTQWTLTSSFNDLNYQLLNTPYGMPYFPPDSPMPYVDKVSRYVSRDLTAAEWRSLLDYYKTTPNQYSYAYLEFYGGAINAYPREGSAFIHRDTVFDSVLDVMWYDDAGEAAAEAFLAGWTALIEPMSNGHVYQNYPRLNETEYAWRYWGDAHAGLYAVKCKYDPTNAFRFAQCVPPLLPPGGGIGPVIILPEPLQAALEQPIVYSQHAGAVLRRQAS